jgi:hypothetical protein
MTVSLQHGSQRRLPEEACTGPNLHHHRDLSSPLLNIHFQCVILLQINGIIDLLFLKRELEAPPP